ncbi:hypothetical protein D3C71_2009240 [compost metagenome]
MVWRYGRRRSVRKLIYAGPSPPKSGRSGTSAGAGQGVYSFSRFTGFTPAIIISGSFPWAKLHSNSSVLEAKRESPSWTRSSGKVKLQAPQEGGM